MTSNFFREQDEIELIIRTDPKTINMANMNSFLIKSPQGILVPLGEIVNISKKQDFSVIKEGMDLEKFLSLLKLMKIFLTQITFLKTLKVRCFLK